MALPQVKGLEPTRLPPDAEVTPHDSAEVVLEAVAPGDSGPTLAKELRLGGRAWTSLSHEERRPGRGGSGLEDVASWLCRSGSSSDDATTSESGVDRLAMKRFFSSNNDPLFDGIPANEARDDEEGGGFDAFDAMMTVNQEG